MGILTTHWLAFLVGSALMAILKKMPELFLNLTLEELGRKMGISKPKLKTYGAAMNPNPWGELWSPFNNPEVWAKKQHYSFTAPQTQTAGNSTSPVAWSIQTDPAHFG